MSEESKRILLVDDEAALRLTIAANLELEGFELTEASDGAHAIELLEQQQFDLVLSDIRMPKVDGIGLFEYIKKNRPKLPVVLMTAFTSESEVGQVIDNGVFTVVGKPFEIDDLVLTLSWALRSPLVLVCDAEGADADATANKLRELGVKALAVGAGDDAILAVRDQDIDVCVTELTLAVGDSNKLIQKIRELEPSITIVAVTNHQGHQAEQIMEAGAFRCLSKPLQISDLAKVIASARAGAAGLAGAS